MKASHLDLIIDLSGDKVSVNPSLNKDPTPLDPDSAHPASIHKGWPCGMVDRVRKLSEPADVDRNLCKLFQVYKNAGSHYYTLEQFACIIGGIKPFKPKHADLGELHRIPFVCRYHPLFPKALNRALTQAPLPPFCQSRIMPAWKNSLPTPLTFVARANRRTCTNMFKQLHLAPKGSIGRDGGRVAAVVSNLSISGLKPYKLNNFL